MKSKVPRKSVSFPASVGGTGEELAKVEVTVPTVKKSVLLLPFHVPILLIGMFYFGLTEAPLATMVKGLANLVVMQLMYGYLCATSLGGKKKQKKKDDEDNVVLLVGAATAVAMLLANVVFVALILFGAPMYGFLWETYVLAYHFALIALQPVLICYKLDYEQFVALFKLDNLYRVVFSNSVLASSALTALGAWLGVIPIPLDWDRPWQQWPITILAGGYLGAFAGSIVGLVVQN